MSIELEISGIEGIGLIRRALINLVPGLKKEIIHRLANAAHGYAQDGADAHTKTGALARSIKLEKRGEGYAVVQDEQVAPHGRFVHWGTRPHEIRPRRKRALRWVAGGAFVFAQRVQHPGYEGDPFMETARAQVASDFDSIARAAFAEVRSGWFGGGQA